MLTQKQIEDKNFTFLQDVKNSNSNDGDHWVFVADRKTKNTVNTDVKYTSCLLEYFYNTGVTKLTDYFEEPIRYKEYYFIGYLKTQAELDEMISKLTFTIEKIDE